MSVKRSVRLTLGACLWPVLAQAQVFEFTRELGTPEHYYQSFPPVFILEGDAIPFPALPNVQFSISGNATIRLHLVARACISTVCRRENSRRRGGWFLSTIIRLISAGRNRIHWCSSGAGSF